MRIKIYGKNQTLLIVNSDLEIFFSYETPVAAIISGHCYKTSFKHSTTTSKHINYFLGKDTRPIYKEQSFFDNLI